MPIVCQGQITITDLNDGDNGKTYILNILNGVRSVTYDQKGNNPSPTQTAFSCELYEDGVLKTPTSYSWSATGLLSGTSTSSTFTPTCATTFSNTNNSISLTVTYDGQTIKSIIPISITKIGNDGTNAIIAVLSNETHTVPTDSSGNNGVFTGANTTMYIYNGATDDSTNWTVSATANNVTGTLSGKTYTVTAMSSDTGYVDLTASRSGYTSITKRFTLTKSKQGAIGNTGATGPTGPSATAYKLISSVAAIAKNISNIYTPSTITISATSATGTAAPKAYAGRFIISETTDGSSYTTKYTSSANESSKIYTPSAGIKAINAKLYLAGGTTTLLDEQTIPIVSDGATGAQGPQGPQGEALDIADGTFNEDVKFWSTSYSSNTKPGASVQPKTASTSIYGGKTLKVTNEIWLYSKNPISIENEKIYKFTFRVRQLQNPTDTTKNKVYAGATEFAHDGTRLSVNNGTYFVASSYSLPVKWISVGGDSAPATYDSTKDNQYDWVEIVKYMSTTAKPAITYGAEQKFPAISAFTTGTKYIKPMFILNYSGGNGIAEIDCLNVEDVTSDYEAAKESANKINNNAQEIFDKVTQEGVNQGLFINNGKVYINGEYINAKNLKVQNASGNLTFGVDNNGNVTIQPTTFTLTPSATNQNTVVNLLNNNTSPTSITNGLYLSGTNLYMNATNIKAGTLSADRLEAGSITADKLIIGIGEGGGLSANPSFSKWSSTYPDGTAAWTLGGISKQTVDGRNVAQFTCSTSGGQYGMSLSSSFFANGVNLDSVEFLALEVKFRLTSGTNPSGACLLFDMYNTDNTSQRLQLNMTEAGTSLTLNTWYTVRKVFKITDVNLAKTFKSCSGYLLANWSSAGNAIKTIQFATANVYIATEQDYLTQSWNYSGTTEINGANIRTGTLSADKITTGILTAQTGGSSFNLNNGTMLLGSTSNSNYLQWNGSALNIGGTVNATSGKVATFTISGSNLIGANVGMSGTSGTNMAFWAGGNTASSAPFRVSHTGALTCTSANISGTVTASAGTIAGYTISGNQLVGTNVGMSGLSGEGVAFWAGGTSSTAPFKVTHAGILTATGANITGTINATSGNFSGSISSSATITGGAIKGARIESSTKTNWTTSDPYTYDYSVSLSGANLISSVYKTYKGDTSNGYTYDIFDLFGSNLVMKSGYSPGNSQDNVLVISPTAFRMQHGVSGMYAIKVNSEASIGGDPGVEMETGLRVLGTTTVENLNSTGQIKVNNGGVFPVGSYTASSGISSLPDGLSIVQGNTSAGFPTDYSTLLSVKHSIYRLFQIASKNTGGLFYRPGHADTGWGTWREVYTDKDWGDSKATNGYCKFPNGVIIQWGYVLMTPTAASTVTSQTITFPIAFPSACRTVQVNPSSTVPDRLTQSASAITASNFVLCMTRTNTTATGYYWFAAGY